MAMKITMSIASFWLKTLYASSFRCGDAFGVSRCSSMSPADDIGVERRADRVVDARGSYGEKTQCTAKGEDVA